MTWLTGWKRWAAIGGVTIVVLVVGIPWLYLNVIKEDAPPPLSVGTGSPSASTTGTGEAEDVSGTWTVTSGSIVGYRVKEVVFGQSGEAYGRTEDVTGRLVIDGTTVKSGSFTADMRTVESDQSRRDGQFRGRIMEVEKFPTATFLITRPIQLSSIPTVGITAAAQATGDLTLHGVTRSVTFTVTGKRTANGFEVGGSVPVVFAHYDIENPSFGPVTTESDGIMEFLLKFSRA